MNKCALVTGASQGIGACIAQRLAKSGYNLAINCYSQSTVENGGNAVAQACRALGVEAECFVADVSGFEACAGLVRDVLERFGSLDVLVNNAGITKDGLMVRMSEEQFDAVISVNLKSVFNMMHHAGRAMMKARSGHIVNIASVAGLYGNAGQINYSAAKAGVVGMTMTAAKELGPRGINVNAVAPGFIETPMTAALPEKIRESALAGITLGRFGAPGDVANAVNFLASDEASYITGQVLVIDGGMVM
ncbi:MAG: 3-oxoacyl-[acyl-carrier-protein] reductase [Clostridia bacterium]|nr:3-oxoacyl-[acyl-carrier-protein] reductase [Clostridia bacterium]MDR3645789.1 3-oxoacyl-[acyl-carrier-protein] reductase [Clostridia bacterium]